MRSEDLQSLLHPIPKTRGPGPMLPDMAFKLGSGTTSTHRRSPSDAGRWASRGAEVCRGMSSMARRIADREMCGQHCKLRPRDLRPHYTICTIYMAHCLRPTTLAFCKIRKCIDGGSRLSLVATYENVNVPFFGHWTPRCREKDMSCAFVSEKVVASAICRIQPQVQ